jgi:hypothetical protein
MSIWLKNWDDNLKKSTYDFLLFHPLLASISPLFLSVHHCRSTFPSNIPCTNFTFWLHTVPLLSWLNTSHFPLYIYILLIMMEAWRYFIVPDVFNTWRLKSSGMWHCAVGWVWSQKTWFFSSTTVRISSLASLTPCTFSRWQGSFRLI